MAAIPTKHAVEYTGYFVVQIVDLRLLFLAFDTSNRPRWDVIEHAHVFPTYPEAKLAKESMGRALLLRSPLGDGVPGLTQLLNGIARRLAAEDRAKQLR